MNRKITLLLIAISLILLSTLVDLSEEKKGFQQVYSCDVDSSDSRLVLYKDGSAIVERMYNVDQDTLQAFINQDRMNIRLDGLSTWIDPKSFMANVIVNEDLNQPQSVSVAGGTVSPTKEKTIHLMFKEHLYGKSENLNEDKKFEIDTKLKELVHEKDGLQKKIASYESVKNQVLHSKFEMSEYEGKLKIIDQMIELVEKTQIRINELNDKIEQLEKEKQEKPKESSMYLEFSSKIPEFIKSNPHPFKIQIKYVINKEKFEWNPQYLLSVDSKAQTGELVFTANVIQKTGENFTNALIELSTDYLGLAPVMPDLNILTLEQTEIYKFLHNTFPRSQENLLMKSMAFSSIQQRNYQNYFGNGNVELGTDENSIVRTDNIKSTTSYIISERCSFLNIPGEENKSNTLLIAKINLESKWYHKVIPKQSTSVYTIMSIKNKSKYQLIPGNVSVFINNVLSSQSAIKSDVYPDDIFNLDIGIDRMISVRIQDNQKNQDSTGWFSTTNVVSEGSQISIENKKDVPVNITIIDALPFTNDWHKDKQLKILLTRPNKDGKDIDLQEIFQEKQANGDQKEGIIPTEYLFASKLGKKDVKCKIKKVNHALERNFVLNSKEKVVLSLAYQMSVTK